MQKQEREIEIAELADKPKLWCGNTFSIDENGHVEGTAHIFDSENGFDITAYVRSYDYERHGNPHTNHVPMVVVTKPDGTIIGEPEAYDSNNPRTAIERAIGTAEWAYDEYQ